MINLLVVMFGANRTKKEDAALSGREKMIADKAIYIVNCFSENCKRRVGNAGLCEGQPGTGENGSKKTAAEAAAL